MKRSETQRVNEWSKKKTKGYYFKLNIEKDADLISWLETISNKQGYFKSLIAQDIIKNKYQLD